MPTLDRIEYAKRITCIDTHYQRPGLAACYLLESEGEAVFIDTGTSHSVPHLMALLERKGIAASQVKYVIPTHVHLDHAGGSGELMRRLPRASLVIHPYGAKHMIDPAKLIAGATAVYGEAEFERQLGRLLPVDETRVIEAPDQTRISFGGRELLILDTPGHARHHFCVYDAESQAFFSGDTFGLSYREFDNENGQFIMPPTTPTQFDPETWLATLQKLTAFSPQRVYITHYGEISDPLEMAKKLGQGIEDFAAIARASGAAPGPQRIAEIRANLNAWMMQGLEAHGCRLSAETIDALMAMDLTLDAQGLDAWLTRMEQA
ncbi:MAG: MBL fold metallo-hydrolase [Candidatus Thiodiazotropha sp.]|nr:MAG: MBL fold metallo-hydrolase [gamma proteobacterium symbiont of Ctena orbiculata]